MNKMPQLSLFGFVLYDAEPFKSRGYTDSDPQFDPTLAATPPKSWKRKQWLDKNAVPFLINRYNGTLVRGE